MSTHCFNDDEPTAVVMVHEDVDPPQISTGGLCTSCATCTSPGCTELGTILDAEYEEPWCARHAAQFSGDEAVHGPRLGAHQLGPLPRTDQVSTPRDRPVRRDPKRRATARTARITWSRA